MRSGIRAATQPRRTASYPGECQAITDLSLARQHTRIAKFIERAIIISHNGGLQLDLPIKDVESDDQVSISANVQTQTGPYTEQERLQRDRINIRTALKVTNGKISGKQGAAVLLGIKLTTLVSRMNSLGIEKSG